MRNKAISISQGMQTINQPVYLDTNVLIFLHPPLGKAAPEAATYGAFVSLLRTRGVKLRVSSIIISEYINTYARLVFNSIFKSKYGGNFKNFRKSADWPHYAQQISKEVSSIISYCEMQHTLSDNPSLGTIIKSFSGGSFDFNDQVIVEGCQLDSAALLTHDGDMEEGGIVVLTDNKNLLAACP